MRSSPQQHRAAIYARVSTLDQEPENQLIQLRRYVEERQWTVTEYVDKGVSGAKDSRPALDRLLRDAKRREFNVLVCWRLDRLGRSLKHLVTLLDDLQALGVAFVSLGEGIDATTPAGKLQMHVLAAISEFERARIAERVRAGLAACQGERETPRQTIRPCVSGSARCGRWIASEGGGGSAPCLTVNAQAVAQEGPTNRLKFSPTFAPFSTYL